MSEPTCEVCGRNDELHVFEDGVLREDGSVEVIGSERRYRCRDHLHQDVKPSAAPRDDLMPHERRKLGE